MVTVTAFVPPVVSRTPWTKRTLGDTTVVKLQESSKLPDIDDMKLSDVRQELESYGISTKVFLEKKEFLEALKKARAEGKKPQKKKASTTTSNEKAAPNGAANGQSGKTRSERIQEEMTKAKSMSVGDLRKELTSRGVKTNAFFEKSDFVKAYAEAVVDGVKAKAGSSGGSSSSSRQEDYDPSYRDVQVRKLDVNARRMIGGNVIDVGAKK